MVKWENCRRINMSKEPSACLLANQKFENWEDAFAFAKGDFIGVRKVDSRVGV